MKRAFTLIELLVVIAIIAILAAILFPVFAQAKEAAKKAQGISNIKQTATGAIIYTTDADDNAPSATSISDGSACGLGLPGTIASWNWAATTPAGADAAICTQTDGQAWINSTQPYIKNWQMMEQPTFNRRDIYTAAYMASFVRPPTTSALTMNGLLHQYSMTAINRPSNIPLFWAGSFKQNWRGGSYSAAPVLLCTGSGSATNPLPCRFNAGGHPVTGAVVLQPYQFFRFVDSTLNSMHHYGQGTVFAYTDTSAKYVPVRGASYQQPWLSVPANGQLTSGIHSLCGSTTVQYPALFRPDNNGDTYPLTWTVNPCNW
ncbi:MAG: prepilin-type N-terminal cleavage/methylation domain-containing protein [Armatimonadota bacterium]